MEDVRLWLCVNYQPLPPAGTPPISLHSQGEKRLPTGVMGRDKRALRSKGWEEREMAIR